MKGILTILVFSGLTQLAFAQNFGIGTVNPNTLLHVNGVGTFGNNFTPSSTEAEGILNLLVGANADGASNGIAFYENNSGFGMKIGYDGTGSGTANAMRIYGSADEELVTFENGGTVRINSLAGSGTRIVTANSDGDLSTSTTVVGFFARTTGHYTSAGVTIVYNTASHNVGGAYNTSNGRFTAPVRGLYHFCWGGIQNPAGTVSRQYLYRNGSNYASSATQLRLDSGSAYGEGCNCATIAMNASDYIYLGEGGAYANYSFFTGHLVAPY